MPEFSNFRRVIAVMTTLLLLALPVAAQKSSAKKKAAPKKTQAAVKSTHPPVDTSIQECRECHESATPQVWEEWLQSAHGLNGVLCFVCHGSTGADFVRVPAAERCAGCHSVQVDSLNNQFMKGKSCFSCHPAHALNPHPPTPRPDPGVDKTHGGAQ
jgi:hypothetical protein